MENNNRIDIFESVKSVSINDLTPEILDTSIDILTESEILKDIPVFGIAFKSVSLYQKISESFFTKKLLKFLFELKEIPLQEREDFIAKIEKNKELNNTGERLLVTLNRLNDIDKAEIIGKLFKKTILGKIEINTFNRLTHIIDNSYVDDLKSIKNDINLRNIDDEIKSNLHQIGLLNQSISDIRRQRRILDSRRSTDDPQPRLEYKVNSFCMILIEHGL